MKCFISYHSEDTIFVKLVNFHLRSQSNIPTYCYDADQRPMEWDDEVESELSNCETFIFFHGKNIGNTQKNEAIRAEKLPNIGNLVLVKIDHTAHLPISLPKFNRLHPITIPEWNELTAQECAKQIAIKLRGTWTPNFEIPEGYPFAYEKDIIKEYEEGRGELSYDRIIEGCPQSWPSVCKNTFYDSDKYSNPVRPETIGNYRKESDAIIVDVKSQYQIFPDHPTDHPKTNLMLLEAGPRATIFFPRKKKNELRVGIIVSGGIAPGINSVIEGIVERHSLYQKNTSQNTARSYQLFIDGYREGFKSLIWPNRVPYGTSKISLTEENLKKEGNHGGSVLSTSRVEKLLDLTNPTERQENFNAIVNQLDCDGIDILYVIGGDGSMRAAHAIWQVAKNQNKNFSVVAIPKTMDNDILWVWQSFGFLSAVERAKEFILQLQTEAQSNPRLCVLQLFGSDSGFVVSHAALASGICDLALIPEVNFSMATISKYIWDRLQKRQRDQGSAYGTVVMSETAIPTDFKDYIEDPDLHITEDEKEAITIFSTKNRRRVRGQTPDALRTGGLKLVSGVLQKKIQEFNTDGSDYWKEYRTFTNEPRHLLRSLNPSTQDVIYGHRLGCLAVDNAMAGYTDFMVSQWLTEFVLVPLRLVVLGRKRVPQKGIFWKSVLASTGQPTILE